MVVIAASVITKSGKVLVSRQFVDMSRTKIEGLLAAYSNLVGACKQHTFLETDEVRFVYQRVEGLYLLLVTNKQSNIFEDLDTLMLLSKLVTEYSHFLNEEGICNSAFELIFAFDEAISLGNKETVTSAQVKQYCEMESQEEELHKMLMQSKINETKDVMKRKAHEIDKSKIEKGRLGEGGLMSISSPRKSESSSTDTGISSSGSGYTWSSSGDTDDSSKSKDGLPALAKAPPKGMCMQLGKGKKTNQFLESLQAEGEVILEDVHESSTPQSKMAVVPVIDPITLTIEERVNVAIKRDGGLNFDVQGTLFLQVLNQEDGFIQLQIESKDISGLSFKLHPNINKDLFYREHIIGLKDPNSSFPTGKNDAGLVKWGIQNLHEPSLPLMVNFWPSVSCDGTFVNIEYEASYMFDLQNVVISIPHSCHEVPIVTQIDGEWRYNFENSVLEWSILLIDDTNRSGTMEYILPPGYDSSFFPINISFTADKTYSDVKVTGVKPLRGEIAPKYTQRMQLVTNSYQVV